MAQDDISQNRIDLFAKRSPGSPRELAINTVIGIAVENWIVGDIDEAVYMTALAEHYFKMTNTEFAEKYDEEEF